MRPDEDARFLPPAQQRALVDLWAAQLAGEDGARRFADGPLRAALPPGWPELALRAFALLDAWRPAAPDPTQQRALLGRLCGHLHRSAWRVSQDPDNPRRGPLGALAASSDTEWLREAPPHLNTLAQDPGSEALLGPFYTRHRAGERSPALTTALREAAAQAVEARALAWEAAERLIDLERLRADWARKREALARIGQALGLGLGQLGLGGDWSSGFWQPGVWERLEALAQAAERSASVQQLAHSLGRWEEAEAALRQVEAALPRPTRPELLRRQRVGAHGLELGAAIERAVPAELALLALPETELLFYQKLVERRLLTVAVDLPPPEDPHPARVVRPEAGAGPVILCLDTSASMAGEREQVAKALTLAVLRMALRQGRPCVCIVFGSANDLREVELSRMPEALPALLELLCGAFGGGTDPRRAVAAALARLDQAAWSRADLLLVTDGVFARDPALREAVAEARARRGLRCHALVLGDASTAERLDFAEPLWLWRPGQNLWEGAVRLLRGAERSG